MIFFNQNRLIFFSHWERFTSPLLFQKFVGQNGLIILSKFDLRIYKNFFWRLLDMTYSRYGSYGLYRVHI